MSLYCLCNSCEDGIFTDRKLVTVGLRKEEFEVDIRTVYYVGKFVLLKIAEYNKTNRPIIGTITRGGTRSAMFSSCESGGTWVDIPIDSLVRENEINNLRAINY